MLIARASSLLICPQLSILHREAEYPCSDVAQNNAPGLLFAGSAAINRGRKHKKSRESLRLASRTACCDLPLSLPPHPHSRLHLPAAHVLHAVSQTRNFTSKGPPMFHALHPIPTTAPNVLYFRMLTIIAAWLGDYNIPRSSSYSSLRRSRYKQQSRHRVPAVAMLTRPVLLPPRCLRWIQVGILDTRPKSQRRPSGA